MNSAQICMGFPTRRQWISWLSLKNHQRIDTKNKPLSRDGQENHNTSLSNLGNSTNYLFLSFCFAVTFHIEVTYCTIILNGTSENESALVNVSKYLEGRKEEVKTI